MKIIPQYDFTTASGSFTPADEASFRQDVQTAINIFDATFTNDITLTLNVGFGSINGRLMKPEDGENGGLGAPNAVVLVTYSQLRDRLMTSGQPGFFNAVNLPAGDSINGMSNFWVSSSQANFGAPPQRPGPRRRLHRLRRRGFRRWHREDSRHPTRNQARHGPHPEQRRFPR
jgi:hypothetical protein